jgi:hypothetical protein
MEGDRVGSVIVSTLMIKGNNVGASVSRFHGEDSELFH